MQIKDLISIIIPVYNAENNINKCVASILKQTYKNWELILIDDGSTDKTNYIINNIINNNTDKRIYLIHITNSGPSSARNIGITKAKGSYITFIDSDDYIDQDYLYTLLSNLRNNDFIVSGYKRVINNKTMSIKPPNNSKWAPYKFCATWGKLYRATLIKNNKLLFPENYKIGEDLYFIASILDKTNRYTSINYDGYNYIDYNKSLTSKAVTEKKEWEKYIEILLEINNKYKDSKCIKSADLYYWISKTLLFYLILLSNNTYVDLAKFYERFLKTNVVNQKELFRFTWKKEEGIKINILYNMFCLFKYIGIEKTIIYCLCL